MSEGAGFIVPLEFVTSGQEAALGAVVGVVLEMNKVPESAARAGQVTTKAMGEITQATDKATASITAYERALAKQSRALENLKTAPEGSRRQAVAQARFDRPLPTAPSDQDFKADRFTKSLKDAEATLSGVTPLMRQYLALVKQLKEIESLPGVFSSVGDKQAVLNQANALNKVSAARRQLNEGTAQLTASEKEMLSVEAKLYELQGKQSARRDPGYQKMAADLQQVNRVEIEHIALTRAINQLYADNAQAQAKLNPAYAAALSSLKELTAVERVKLAQDKLMVEWQNKVAEAQAKQSPEVKKLITQYNELTHQVTRATGANRAFSEQLAGSNQMAAGFRAALAGIGMGFGIYTGATIVAASATYSFVSAVRSIVDSGAEFEKEMARVSAAMQLSSTQYQDLTKRANEMANSSRYAAGDVVKAYREMAMSGFTYQETVEGIHSVLKMASIGMMDFGQAADIATNVLYGFNLNAADLAHVVDVLATTVTRSAQDLQQLGTAMSYIAPIAASFGLSLEMAAAATEVLANAGIKSSRAGTGLRRTFTALFSDSENVSVALRDLGVSVNTMAYDMDAELLRVLKELNKATNGATTGVGSLTKAVGLYAVPAFLNLVKAAGEGKDSLEAILKAYEDVGGAASKMQARMEEGLKVDWEEALAALSKLQNEIFLIFGPSMREGVQIFTAWLRAFGENKEAIHGVLEEMKGLLQTVTVLVGVLAGGAMLKSLGKLVTGAGEVWKGWTAAAAGAAAGAGAVGAGAAGAALGRQTRGVGHLQQLRKVAEPLDTEAEKLSGKLTGAARFSKTLAVGARFAGWAGVALIIKDVIDAFTALGSVERQQVDGLNKLAVARKNLNDVLGDYLRLGRTVADVNAPVLEDLGQNKRAMDEAKSEVDRLSALVKDITVRRNAAANAGADEATQKSYTDVLTGWVDQLNKAADAYKTAQEKFDSSLSSYAKGQVTDWRKLTLSLPTEIEFSEKELQKARADYEKQLKEVMAKPFGSTWDMIWSGSKTVEEYAQVTHPELADAANKVEVLTKQISTMKKTLADAQGDLENHADGLGETARNANKAAVSQSKITKEVDEYYDKTGSAIEGAERQIKNLTEANKLEGASVKDKIRIYTEQIAKFDELLSRAKDFRLTIKQNMADMETLATLSGEDRLEEARRQLIRDDETLASLTDPQDLAVFEENARARFDVLKAIVVEFQRVVGLIDKGIAYEGANPDLENRTNLDKLTKKTDGFADSVDDLRQSLYDLFNMDDSDLPDTLSGRFEKLMRQSEGLRVNIGKILSGEMIRDKSSSFGGGSTSLTGTGAGVGASAKSLQGIWDKYGDLIKKAASSNGVDTKFMVALISAESGGDPTVTSDAGAQGLMQFMPKTAAQYGVNDPFDPAQAIPGAARYIKYLKSLFGDDPAKLAAAYNAGEGHLQSRGGDVSKTWAESQNHAAKVLKRMAQLENLAEPEPAEKAAKQQVQAVVTQAAAVQQAAKPAPAVVAASTGEIPMLEKKLAERTKERDDLKARLSTATDANQIAFINKDVGLLDQSIAAIQARIDAAKQITTAADAATTTVQASANIADPGAELQAKIAELTSARDRLSSSIKAISPGEYAESTVASMKDELAGYGEQIKTFTDQLALQKAAADELTAAGKDQAEMKKASKPATPEVPAEVQQATATGATVNEVKQVTAAVNETTSAAANAGQATKAWSDDLKLSAEEQTDTVKKLQDEWDAANNRQISTDNFEQLLAEQKRMLNERAQLDVLLKDAQAKVNSGTPITEEQKATFDALIEKSKQLREEFKAAKDMEQPMVEELIKRGEDFGKYLKLNSDQLIALGEGYDSVWSRSRKYYLVMAQIKKMEDAGYLTKTEAALERISAELEKMDPLTRDFAENVVSSLFDVADGATSGKEAVDALQKSLKDMVKQKYIIPIGTKMLGSIMDPIMQGIQGLMGDVMSVFGNMLSSAVGAIGSSIAGAGGASMDANGQVRSGGTNLLEGITKLFTGNSIGQGVADALSRAGFGTVAMGPPTSTGAMSSQMGAGLQSVASVPNWAYGIGAMAGNLISSAIFKGKGYSDMGAGIGSALGSIGGAYVAGLIGAGAGMSGAAMGAMVGSVVPIVGTIIGAIIGSVAGGFLGSLFGDEKPRVGAMSMTTGGGVVGLEDYENGPENYAKGAFGLNFGLSDKGSKNLDASEMKDTFEAFAKVTQVMADYYGADVAAQVEASLAASGSIMRLSTDVDAAMKEMVKIIAEHAAATGDDTAVLLNDILGVVSGTAEEVAAQLEKAMALVPAAILAATALRTTDVGDALGLTGSPEQSARTLVSYAKTRPVKSGETSTDAIGRVITELSALDFALKYTATSIKDMPIAQIGDLAEALAKSFGGVEKLLTAQQTYYDQFFTATEKATDSAKLMLDQLKLEWPKIKDKLLALNAPDKIQIDIPAIKEALKKVNTFGSSGPSPEDGLNLTADDLAWMREKFGDKLWVNPLDIAQPPEQKITADQLAEWRKKFGDKLWVNPLDIEQPPEQKITADQLAQWREMFGDKLWVNPIDIEHLRDGGGAGGKPEADLQQIDANAKAALRAAEMYAFGVENGTITKNAETEAKIQAALNSYASELKTMGYDVTQGVLAVADQIKNWGKTTFMTDLDRTSLTKDPNAEIYAKLVNDMPRSRDEFNKLIGQINLTTEAGRLLYTELMGLVPAFDAMYDSIEGFETWLGVRDEKEFAKVRLEKVFKDLGLVLPSTKDALKALYTAGKLTAEQLAILGANLEDFDAYYGASDSWDPREDLTNATIAKLESALDKFTEELNKSKAIVEAAKSAIENLRKVTQNVESYQEELRQRARAALGQERLPDDINDIIRGLGEVNANDYGNYDDYMAAVLENENLLRQIKLRAENQVSWDERQVQLLQEQIDLAKEALLKEKTEMQQYIKDLQTELANAYTKLQQLWDTGLGATNAWLAQISDQRFMMIQEEMQLQGNRSYVLQEAGFSAVVAQLQLIDQHLPANAATTLLVPTKDLPVPPMPSVTDYNYGVPERDVAQQPAEGTDQIAELITEVRTLRTETRETQTALVTLTRRSTDTLSRWEGDGLPPDREEYLRQIAYNTRATATVSPCT